MNVYSISLGCPKNRVDTETMLGVLGASFSPVEEVAEADLVFINTCAFIGPAIEESIQTIVETVSDIEAAGGERPVLAVAGCLVSRFGERDLKSELPEVDVWVATDCQDDWPSRLAEALEKSGRAIPGFMADARLCSTGPSYAYLKISEGCDNTCAFCTIPSIRGPLKSAPLDAVERQAKRLLDTGVKELVLVAQDVTAWGRDMGLRGGLIPLLERLLPLDGLRWLRPMYLYPAGLTDEVLRFMAEAGEPLLPYFDIPMQHAHPDVLSSMGRPFARDPRRVVDRVRKHFPSAALRTTFITGYPGETDEHFRTLRDFVAETRFHHVGVFAYCREEGTPAADMPGQVPGDVAGARRDEIMEVQSEISEMILDDCVGEEFDVIVDAASPEWPGLYTGRVWFQAPEVDGITYVSGPGTSEDPDLEPGDMVRATVEDAKTYDLVALL